jgi:hypothetical protein
VAGGTLFAGEGFHLLSIVNNVLVTTAVPDQKTAWTKARMDVLQILRNAGYATVQLPTRASTREWLSLLSTLKNSVDREGHILIEYPFDQRKRVYVLYLFRLLKRVKLYGLIHDLDSIRFDDSPREREVAILKLFDGLISHNPTMTRWLSEGGISAKVVDLNLFDYCTRADRTWHESEMSSPLKVLSAGNLSWDKARYIYDPALAGLRNVELSLYGAFFEPGRMPPSNIRYKGVFDPDMPLLDDSYHFGLVWDGTGVSSCEGRYGRYMRFNNPHKLSLYVSLGLPVIVWKEAAIAEFVLQQDIGVTVADLRELGDVAGRVSTPAYRSMAANVLALSSKVKRGDFLNQALGQLVH